MAENTLKLLVVADTSPVDKQIDQVKKNAANKEIEIPVNIDLSEIKKALNSLQEMAGKMQNAFEGNFKFSGLQKEIDNVSSKMNNLIKETKEGVSYINVKPMGLQNMKADISEMTHNIKELNSAKIDLDSFNKLEGVLRNIETILSSIQTGLNLETIRPSVMVQDQIDGLNKSLDNLDLTKIDRANSKFEKLVKFFNDGRISNNVMKTAFGDGELGGLKNVDTDQLDKVMQKMKEYMTFGGDLSTIKFPIIDAKTGEENIRSLQDLLDLIKASGNQEFDVINVSNMGNQLQAVRKTRDEIKALNEELEKSKVYESRGMNISLDTKSIEEFSAAVQKAVENFDGLSGGNLDSVIGKLDEVITPLKNIADLFSGNIDIVSDEKINGIGEKIQTGLRDAATNFGEDLTYSVEDFSGSLKALDFDSIFSSLRESLLDIVKQFQTSLNNVSFSKEQTGEIYSLLKQWNDASSVLLKTGNKDSERAALLNKSSGSVSNSYLYDKEGSFSGKILDELNRLSIGVSGQIGELYDTWVHSHPLQKAEAGLKALGANIGFSPEDFNIYKNKYFGSGVTNMMVANNGKYTNINWDGISKDLIGQVVSLFKSSDIFDANGIFRGNKAVENDVYNFDKQSSLINSAIIDAMKKVGIQDAESRLTTGNIEDLSADLSRLQQQEQNAKQEAQQLVELFQKLSNVVDNVNNGSLQFGISEDSLKSVVDKLNEIVEAINKINTSSIQPEVKVDNGLNSVVDNQQKIQEELKETIALEDEFGRLLSQDFATSNKTEATKQLKQAYEAYKPFFEDNDQTANLSAAGTKAGYAYYKSFEEAVRKGIAQSSLDKYSIQKDYYGRSGYTSKHSQDGTTEDFNDTLTQYTTRMKAFSDIVDEIKAKFGSIDLRFDMSIDGMDSMTVIDDIEKYVKEVEYLNKIKNDPYYSAEQIARQSDWVKKYKEDALETAKLLSEINPVSNAKSSTTPALSQTFDNDVQRNLVYLENYKNTIKEIDNLKLEPETDETIQKMKELNSLADYYVSQISVITSENGHTVSAEMMRFGHSWNESLKQYPHDKAQELYDLASAKYGLQTNLEMPEFKYIGNEIAAIEAKSEGLRLSLAQDLTDSRKYVNNLADGFIDLAAATEGLKTAKSPRWIETFNKDIDKILAKYPELEQFKNKFTESSAEEFIKTDGWNNFLSQLPKAQKYLESIGYSGQADTSQQMGKLKEGVASVTTAVDTKTRAFQEEEQIVVGTVQREIASLQLLDGQLYDIVGTLEKLKSSSLNLGFKSGQDNIDNGILRLFNDLNEATANLNIDSLTKISESLKGIEVSPNTSENLKQVAVALKEFKDSISGLSLEDNNFLSSINNLVTKTADLKTLCQVLEESSERIKEANKLLNDNTGQDNTQINASEKIKNIKSEIESLSGSLSKGFQNNIGIEKFIDQLEEVSRKYKELNNLKNTNPEAIDTTELSSLSRYYATFLEDLSANSIGKFDLSTKTPQFVAQLKEAESQLKLVQAALLKVQSGEAFTDEDIANIKKYIDQIRELNKASKQDSSKFANYANVHNMLGKIADIMNKNTSMSKGLRQEFEALDAEMRSFGGNIPADKFKEFGHRLAELEARMKKTRQTGLSFFDGVAKKARTMSQNFIAMYFSFYDWIRYIRQGFTVLKELDTALTEMRKVSDESVTSLKNYQKVSFDAASAVGTTGKQIQNSTADWMGIYLVPLYGNI